MQSHPIDFNNDGLKDLVVVYTDGTVRLLKNYGKPVSGGQSPYQDLETLLLVADHIDEVFVGDVDGNEYEDLLFRLQNGEIRVYLNT
ncbi:VCBS repeat-containing protein [bacterium]|nr:VCBS repeat-containing protein [bacterium]